MSSSVISRRRIEPRVGQIDASILDGELLSMLKTQLFSAFKTFKPEIKDKYEAELLLALKLALFKVTVWDHSATYGAKLQNLKFLDARSKSGRSITQTQRALYGLVVVGGAYVWDKLEEYLARASYSGDVRAEKVRKLTDFLTTVWTASSLSNFVLFLLTGKYSTLILRLLRIRLAAATTGKVSRQVNFEFQNRQLVWNAFTEFLLFILPLVNLAKLKRSMVRLLSGGGKGPEDGTLGELAFLPEKTCGVCYKSDADNDSVTNPYVGECGHAYCYVCLRTKLDGNEGDGWSCLRCGSLVKTAVPYVDIDESAIAVRADSEVVMSEKPKDKIAAGEEDDSDEEFESAGSSEEDDDEDDAGQGDGGFIVHDDNY